MHTDNCSYLLTSSNDCIRCEADFVLVNCFCIYRQVNVFDIFFAWFLSSEVILVMRYIHIGTQTLVEWLFSWWFAGRHAVFNSWQKECNCIYICCPVPVFIQWRENWNLSSVVNSHLMVDPTIRQPGFDLPRRGLSWIASALCMVIVVPAGGDSDRPTQTCVPVESSKWCVTSSIPAC